MIRRILNSKSKSITFSASLISFSVGVSALLGLLRDRLLVSYFDVGRLDIYFVAFRIPDFVYGVLITGGIVAAFLPVFSGTLKRKKSEGWRLASNTLNTLLLALVILCGVLFVFAPSIMKLIAPGFSTEYLEKTVLLTRIMMISPILLGISSLFSGILQYFDRFLVYSLAPVLYNVGIIVGIIFFTPYFGLVGLAYGVIFGSLLHLLIQIPSAFCAGFSYKPLIDLRQKELRKIYYLILPRVVSQASTKINVIVITALASLLTAGSISIFNLANHLQSFPVRVIGVAFAVAAFPALSRSLAEKEKEKFLSSLSMVIRQTLFFIIPISVSVFLLRAHIVRLVLGAREFGWMETQLTAASLGVFAFSFFAAALVHILIRAFFSFQDTKTPLLASVISMGTNIGLSIFFVWVLGFDNFFRNGIAILLRLEAIPSIEVVAFPLALLLSTVLHFSLLVYFLRERVGSFRGMGIGECLQKTLFSSLVMGVVLFAVLRITGGIMTLDTFFSVLLQASIAFLAAAATYIILARVFEVNEFYGVLEAFSKKQKT